jgi:hypothetical protein
VVENSFSIFLVMEREVWAARVFQCPRSGDRIQAFLSPNAARIHEAKSSAVLLVFRSELSPGLISTIRASVASIV